MTFYRATMSRAATTITAGRETTCARMTLDPSMTGRLVYHRRVEIIVTTCAFHYRGVQCHAKKDAATVATATVRTISTPMVTIEDRKSGSNEYHVKLTAETSAKPHAISRLPGGNRFLDTA